MIVSSMIQAFSKRGYPQTKAICLAWLIHCLFPCYVSAALERCGIVDGNPGGSGKSDAEIVRPEGEFSSHALNPSNSGECGKEMVGA